MDSLIVRIEDTERFVDEVADAAYEKAVEVVTKTVQEEIRNEDFDLITEQRRIILNNADLTDGERKLAGRIFAGLMNRFRGMTQYITDQLAALLRTPEKKAEIKEPIRKSLLGRLAKAQVDADAYNAARRAGRTEPRKSRDRYER